MTMFQNFNRTHFINSLKRNTIKLMFNRCEISAENKRLQGWNLRMIIKKIVIGEVVKVHKLIYLIEGNSIDVLYSW